MKTKYLIHLRWKNPSRASILMTSIVMMTVAGVSALGWLSFINAAAENAQQERGRTVAFYAAEAGVEEVVNYFNHPSQFPGPNPDNYTEQAVQPAKYPLTHPDVAPDEYPLFEPYIIRYSTGVDGSPQYIDTDLVVTRWSFFQDVSAGTNPLVSKTSKIPSAVLDVSDNERLVFNDEKGNMIARVKKIELVHPSDIELIRGELPEDYRIITLVIATGVTRDGVEVKVESIITENATVSISSPGAIVSRASATFNGNFNVRWGEIWTLDNVNLPSNWDVKMPKKHPTIMYSSSQNYDQWFRLRSEGVIKNSQDTQFADGRASSGFSDFPVPDTAQNYYIPYHPDSLWVGTSGNPDPKLEYRDNIEQHQILEFPDYEYRDWKDYVLDYGYPYYFTDENGGIYGLDEDPDSGTFGQYIKNSYEGWFHTSPDSEEYDEVTKKVVFIDSVPVNDAGEVAPRDGRGVPILNDEFYPRPPSDPASKLAKISISGGGIHTRGAMFVTADMDMTGQGSPPSWKDVPDVVMPNMQPPPTNENFNIFHNGLMYSWGTISGGGNRVVYGSVFAEEGFLSGGDPQVFFNVRMKDGSWLNLNASRVNRRLWDFSD